MTTWNLDEYVAAHQSVYAYYREVCARQSAEELAVQSLCPDWDVRGVVAHTIGVEAVLDGWEPSDETPPPFGKMGEVAAEFAGLDPAALEARVEEITSSRMAHLQSLDASVVDRASFTPTGVATYGDFLRVRAFDLWVHARDIAIPLGEVLDDGGFAAEMALDEVARATGYIVGKKIGLPDGMSIVFHVTGGVERDIALRVDGRATPVDSLDAPDVEVTADVTTFVMLAAGRIDPQEPIDAGRITWSGDAEWGERAARNLAYTR